MKHVDLLQNLLHGSLGPARAQASRRHGVWKGQEIRRKMWKKYEKVWKKYETPRENDEKLRNMMKKLRENL